MVDGDPIIGRLIEEARHQASGALDRLLESYRNYLRLLARTGELTNRTQRRYDDTVIVLDAILEHGLASETGRTALRRMNQMHGAYDISNDDKLYVLCTFVVVPIRWLDRYGWRRLTEAR